MAATFQTLVLWMDVLLVGAMTSTRQAGIYATASRFVLLGTLAIEAVRLAIAPQLGAMFARNDLAGAQRMYGVATWWLMVPSWPVYVLIAAFAPVFLRLFGQGFGEAQDVLVILSIAMLFNIGTGNVTVVLLMAGKSVWNLGNALIAFVINLGLNLLLIPRFGITGAAIAWTVSIVWENLAPLVQIRRAFGLTPFGGGYVRVATAALVAFGGVGLAIRFSLGAGVPQLVLAILIAVVPYIYRLEAGARRPRGGRAGPGDEVSSVETREGRGRDRGCRRDPGRCSRERPMSSMTRTGDHQSTGTSRALAKSSLRSFGILTAPLRGVPDFLIIGAKRAASTSLWNHVVRHPNVLPMFPSRQKIKGTSFFTTNWDKGQSVVSITFRGRGSPTDADSSGRHPPLTGEATPYYLFHPHAPARAAAVAQDAKIVAILRDPVDRAYSHYGERVRHGAETLSFEDALAAEGRGSEVRRRDSSRSRDM